MFGVFGTAAYHFTISPLGPGKATLISNAYVVNGAVLAVWILKERLTAAKLIGNVVAFAGLVMLIGLSPRDLSIVTGYELLALLGAFMAAATVIVIRQLTRTESSVADSSRMLWRSYLKVSTSRSTPRCAGTMKVGGTI